MKKKEPKALANREKIQTKILLLRGQRAVIDSDLAQIYGVSTKRLNEQVKRNIERFPVDFMFQLNDEEKQEVVANCDHLSNLRFSPNLPYAFTEHGAIMAASVLSTPQAVEMSVFVVRAFVKLREMIISHKDLERKVTALERKYDVQFKVVFDAIKKLMTPEQKPKRKIGFIDRDSPKKGKGK